jgi:signal transduction histidine kinase
LLRSRQALLASRRDLERANEELARLNSGYANALKRVESANRAKDSFIANINHEFRTPLNAIIGFAKLMRMDADGDDRAKLKEYAAYVDEAGNGLLNRIKRILEYVVFDSGDRTVDREPFAVSFADEGPGLPAGFLKTIGERFNILQPVLNRGGEVQGLGLGLSLAKRISDVVGGRLEFSANSPKGTVATLILSAAGNDQAPS